MEMVNRLLEEISTTTFEVGSWLWVDVLHVNNPHNFYVRPRTYSKYLPLLQARGRQARLSDINVGDIYIYKSETLKCNVRGQIAAAEQVGEHVLYKFFAVDIGCTEEGVPLNRIWTPLYPAQVPSLVTLCQLADCSPRGGTWDYGSIDAMRIFVEGERARLIIRSKNLDKVVVELYNSRPDDIATMLALTNCTSFGYASNAAAAQFQHPPIENRYYIYRESYVDEELHVRMMSGSLFEQFYVTPIEDYHLYLTDRDNYTSYARPQNDVYMEDLKINQPIGVLYNKNNKFERALVKELLPDSNTAKVQLVDWGIVIEETLTKMKAVPDWYLRVPTRALCCTLHSTQSYSSKLSALSYPGTEFQITIKTVGDDDIMCPYVVTVSQLNN